MFERDTVFVVGAGASCELGLPTGDDLRAHIASAIRTNNGRSMVFEDETVQAAMMRIATARGGMNWSDPIARLGAAADRLRSALPYAQSIDNCLDAHRADEDAVIVGKIGIARAILKAEGDSSLATFLGPTHASIVSSEKRKQFEKSWYLPIFRLFNSRLPLDRVEEIFQNVSFVVFNYDRCLEHFLMHALMTYYGVNEVVAMRALAGIEIVHAYGKVGSLPWQHEDHPADFGEFQSEYLLEIAQSIKTFTESATSGTIQQARNLIAGATTLVFMGFGFLPQNLQLLEVPNSNVARVFMTTKGISDSDVPIVEQEVARTLGKPIPVNFQKLGKRPYETYIERETCGSLMSNHWVRLTRENPQRAQRR